MLIERFKLSVEPFTPADVDAGLCGNAAFRAVLLHRGAMYYRGIYGAATTDPETIARAEIVFAAEDEDETPAVLAYEVLSALIEAGEIPRRSGSYEDPRCDGVVCAACYCQGKHWTETVVIE